MITDADIKRLAKTFATKNELRFEIQDFRREIAENVVTKQDLENLRIEIEGLMTKQDGRKIMAMIEEVMGEIKEVRQEQTVHAQRHDDLESIPIIAQHLRHNQ